LRDNWTLYKANDRRNFLAPDRLNYDVLNHTDLSRDGGTSGDIDLSHVNWGNYDLVVIDESHNFRNKRTPRQGGETRYDRLMRKIIQEGVKTRVLMLSATPVNNRMADLRNQIAFATEGDDTALADCGISSIDATTRLAQKQFNRWLDLKESERTPARLIEMLGFDYFTLLDLLTIARSGRRIAQSGVPSSHQGRSEGLRPRERAGFHPQSGAARPRKPVADGRRSCWARLPGLAPADEHSRSRPPGRGRACPHPYGLNAVGRLIQNGRFRGYRW
jgi:hypothetical protein